MKKLKLRTLTLCLLPTYFVICKMHKAYSGPKSLTLQHMFNLASNPTRSFVHKSNNGYKVNIIHMNDPTYDQRNFAIRERSLVFKSKKSNHSDISLIPGPKDKKIYLEKDELLYIKTYVKDFKDKVTTIIPDNKSLTIIKEKSNDFGDRIKKTVTLKARHNIPVVHEEKVKTDLYGNRTYYRSSKYDGKTRKLIEELKRVQSRNSTIIAFENDFYKSSESSFNNMILNDWESKVTGLKISKLTDRTGVTSLSYKFSNGDRSMSIYDSKNRLIMKNFTKSTPN